MNQKPLTPPQAKPFSKATRPKRKTVKRSFETKNVEEINDLPVHPLASAFPLIENEEFARLVEDVKSKGVIQPVLIANNRLIDGRNRLRAAIKAGRGEIKVTNLGKLTDAEVNERIVSSNSMRRHLSKRELAELAWKYIKDQESVKQKITNKKAALIFGISERYLRQIKKEDSVGRTKPTSSRVLVPNSLTPHLEVLKQMLNANDDTGLNKAMDMLRELNQDNNS